MSVLVGKIGIVSILLFYCLSCQSNKSCNESSDMVNNYNLYNVTLWRPFLDKRVSNDTLLYKKLLQLSVLVGDFARDAIVISGGMTPNDNLVSPCARIQINEKELNSFYNKVSSLIEEIHEVKKYSETYEELNRVFQYLLFSEDGLNVSKILASSVEQISTKLFFLENYCYFLIVKYA